MRRLAAVQPRDVDRCLLTFKNNKSVPGRGLGAHEGGCSTASPSAARLPRVSPGNRKLRQLHEKLNCISRRFNTAARGAISLSISLFVPLSLSVSLSLSVPLCLSVPLSLSLSLCVCLSVCLSLSLSHTEIYVLRGT